ncbi:hypothetical protein KQ940_18035 [Marinobacterium sp. D7]|uniref:2-keto-4-pentenoate hydratase n=1 Tax=Marinobacterium ramblicola TaxID=2849041 RepID=UPI001C2CD195|nr:hypothetical protein [Marinobacterium ramblicola]MBV1789958.1 hypothetical protein [Marinobacterium ramblicola]
MSAVEMMADEIAGALDGARRQAAPLQLLSGLDEAGVDEGYCVQRAQIALNQARDNGITGWKAAMSNRPAMERFGLQKPIYAPLFADMCLHSEVLSLQRVIAPKLEAEVLFVLHEDIVAAQCSDEQIINAIGALAPAFEVADSRMAGWRFNIATFVADLAVASHYRLGELQPFDAGLAFDDIDCVLAFDGTAQSGSVDNVIGGPLGSMVGMVRDIVARYGEVKAGQHFLSGSLTKPLDMVTGTTYCLRMFGQQLKLEYR